MVRIIDQLKLIFLSVFAVAAVVVFVYHLGWAWPAKRCEAAHKWWDWRERVCATPVLISDITGRVIQDKEGEAAALRAMGRPVSPPAGK